MRLTRSLSIAAGIGLTLSSLTGCDSKEVRKEYSGVLHEKGVVVATLYSKDHSQSDINMGISMSGDFTFTPTTIRIPERWGVVFRCDHGNKSPITSPEDKYKALWNKLDEGMDVDIAFRELYRNTYEDTNNDGEKELISRELLDYDFLDANPIQGTGE